MRLPCQGRGTLEHHPANQPLAAACAGEGTFLTIHFLTFNRAAGVHQQRRLGVKRIRQAELFNAEP